MTYDNMTMKTALVKLLYDKGEAWDYELVAEIQKIYGKSSDYWKWVIRFWTIELTSSNIFKAIDSAEDDGRHFAKEKVIYKLTTSNLGKERIESLKI
ncbi:hypothetical protein [Methanococcoides sp. FTZ1]|uniref:hypothetical protein n=1 Tax=Methanococcoides sp. FTZ1 TaxID=3439061 RepID=UPI003F849848